MSRPEPWSGEEVIATVETYKKMLIAELCGQHYVKTEHNRELAKKLHRRSRASIEFKHQNISAVLRDADCPYINGYKPMSNYQPALFTSALIRRLEVAGRWVLAPGALSTP